MFGIALNIYFILGTTDALIRSKLSIHEHVISVLFWLSLSNLQCRGLVNLSDLFLVIWCLLILF